MIKRISHFTRKPKNTAKTDSMFRFSSVGNGFHNPFPKNKEKKTKRISQSVLENKIKKETDYTIRFLKKKTKNPNGFHNPFCKKIKKIKRGKTDSTIRFLKQRKKNSKTLSQIHTLSNTQTSTQHTFQTISEAGLRQNNEDVHIQTYN